MQHLSESSIQSLLEVIEKEQQLNMSSMSTSDFRGGLRKMKIVSKRDDGGTGCYYKVDCPKKVAVVYMLAWAHHMPFHMRVTRGIFKFAVNEVDYGSYYVGAHHPFVPPLRSLNHAFSHCIPDGEVVRKCRDGSVIVRACDRMTALQQSEESRRYRLPAPFRVVQLGHRRGGRGEEPPDDLFGDDSGFDTVELDASVIRAAVASDAKARLAKDEGGSNLSHGSDCDRGAPASKSAAAVALSAAASAMDARRWSGEVVADHLRRASRGDYASCFKPPPGSPPQVNEPLFIRDGDSWGSVIPNPALDETAFSDYLVSPLAECPEYKLWKSRMLRLHGANWTEVKVDTSKDRWLCKPQGDVLKVQLRMDRKWQKARWAKDEEEDRCMAHWDCSLDRPDSGSDSGSHSCSDDSFSSDDSGIDCNGPQRVMLQRGGDIGTWFRGTHDWRKLRCSLIDKPAPTSTHRSAAACARRRSGPPSSSPNRDTQYPRKKGRGGAPKLQKNHDQKRDRSTWYFVATSDSTGNEQLYVVVVHGGASVIATDVDASSYRSLVQFTCGALCSVESVERFETEIATHTIRILNDATLKGACQAAEKIQQACLRVAVVPAKDDGANPGGGGGARDSGEGCDPGEG